MEQPALLVVDVQKGLDEPWLGKRNNPDAESNIALLLSEWRNRGLPVVHIQHCSKEPDSPLRPELPGNAFKAEARPLPKEKRFQKSVNSAFIGTGLAEYLHERRISSLVIVGMTTSHCVSATARTASDLGFSVTVISNATAAFECTGHDGVNYSAEDVHNINLVSLNGEFCTIRSTEEMLKRFA